jgi:hypothetical protein
MASNPFDEFDVAPSSAITPTLLDAVKHVESRGNVNAVSPAGARGPYQFMPGTAREMGLTNPHDEPTAREAASRYLTQLSNKFGGDVDKALLAYNWGPGNVERHLKTGGPMPLEAQQYVGKVRAAEQKMSGNTQANPFDEFDDVAPTLAQRVTKPTVSPVATEAKKMVEEDTGQALKAGIALTASKVARAVNHILPQAVSAFAEKHGFMPSEQDVEILKQSIADSATGKTANIATEIAATAIPGGAAMRGAQALPLVRAAPAMVRNIAGGAAAGAAGNAAIDEDIGQGALFGGVAAPVMSVAGRLGSRVVGGIQDIVGGPQGAATRKLRDIFGDRTAAAVAALRGTQGIVPGETPTAGRAASEFLPEFKVMEDVARRSPAAEALLMQDAQNMAARQNVLEGHARLARPGVAVQDGPIPLSPAAEMRQAGTSANYARANSDRIDLTPELEAIVRGEEARAASRAGDRAFSQQQTNAFAGGGNIPRGAVAGSPGGPGGRDAAGMPMPSIPGNRSVQDLQQFKNELTAKIERIRMSDPEEAYRLSQARRQLTEQMEAQSPSYSAATTNYRELSRPQNQGEVANVMLNALRGSRGGATEDVGGFLRSVEDAPRTIKNAMGTSRYQQLEQVMTPQQMAEINALRNSATREARYASLDVPESVVRKYESVFDTIANNSPGVFNQIVTVFRAAAKRLGRQSDADVEAIVNRAVRSPEEMARLLESLPPVDRNATINAIRRIGARPETSGAIIGATAPAISEEQNAP